MHGKPLYPDIEFDALTPMASTPKCAQSRKAGMSSGMSGSTAMGTSCSGNLFPINGCGRSSRGCGNPGTDRRTSVRRRTPLDRCDRVQQRILSGWLPDHQHLAISPKPRYEKFLLEDPMSDVSTMAKWATLFKMLTRWLQPIRNSTARNGLKILKQQTGAYGQEITNAGWLWVKKFAQNHPDCCR